MEQVTSIGEGNPRTLGAAVGQASWPVQRRANAPVACSGADPPLPYGRGSVRTFPSRARKQAVRASSINLETEHLVRVRRR